MAKSAINKTLQLSANGILGIAYETGSLVIENPDTGELIDLRILLSDFLEKTVQLNITYDYN